MSQSVRDNLILGGVLATLICGVTAVLYVPQTRKLQRLRGWTAERKVRLAQEAQRGSGVPEMARQIEAMKARYRNFDRRLPKRKELGGFLREISGNLAGEDLSNQLIEPGSPEREQLFHTLPIILRFRGSYLALSSFLKRIDKMERLTRVQKLTISHKGKPDGGELEIELHMNIYFTES